MALAKKKATTIALDPETIDSSAGRPANAGSRVPNSSRRILPLCSSYAAPTVGPLPRAMEVDRRFADLGLGLVDASIVALAESLGIHRLVTRDVRHFTAVRVTAARSSW